MLKPRILVPGSRMLVQRSKANNALLMTMRFTQPMLLPLPWHTGAAIFNLAPLRFYQTDFSDYSDGEGDDSNGAGLSGMRDVEFYSVQGRSGIE